MLICLYSASGSGELLLCYRKLFINKFLSHQFLAGTSQFGNDLEKIIHYTKIGLGEDGSFRILINSHDAFR
jgi:hypothetical protein